MDFIKEFGDKVSIMDVEDGLQIVNYNHCDNNSSKELKSVRGVVQEVESGKVLFESFPYTEEYEFSRKDDWIGKIGSTVEDDWDVFYSLEGTLLRVFWHGSKWFVSTNKKLNAFKSRWSSRKSFGDMFKEAITAQTKDENIAPFLDTLEKDHVYFFLVRYNQENRVVCQVEKEPTKQLVYIGRSLMDANTLTLDKTWPHPTIPMTTPEQITGFTLDKLDERMKALDLHKYQGFLFFHKTKNIQIKLIPDEYKRLYQIRGNNPNIRFRYLEIRQDEKLRKEFLNMYPLSQDLFLEYENILYQIAKLVRIYYIQRYIKNKYVTLPKEEYILMKKCHEWYLSNREENRINVSKVMEILNQEDVLSLYKMIRRYQMNQNQSNEETEYHHPQRPMMMEPFRHMTPPPMFPDICT